MRVDRVGHSASVGEAPGTAPARAGWPGHTGPPSQQEMFQILSNARRQKPTLRTTSDQLRARGDQLGCTMTADSQEFFCLNVPRFEN